MNPTIDPEFRDLLPTLTLEELTKLEANILRDGCTTPIVLWQGLIADGHNRFDICTRNKLGFQTNHISITDYPDRNAVMLWMLDNQGGRRNLADIDKISIATKKEAILAAQAKERQLSGLKQNQDTVEPISAQRTDNARTREEAAKSAGVGKTKYDEGKVILDAVASGEVPPEVVADLRAGKASVHKVAKEIKEKRKSAAVAKAEAAIPKPAERTGDLKKIEDVMGEAFARAVEIGTILKTPNEKKAFMALTPADQKAIQSQVLKGWAVGAAVQFIHQPIDKDTRIHDLINRCIGQEEPLRVEVNGFFVTTERGPTVSPFAGK